MPKAHLVKGRNIWESKGIDPATQKRKSYYGASAEEASRKALLSFGRCQDNSLFNFYSNVYLPTVKHHSKNWLIQIGWAMDVHILPKLGDRDLRTLKRPELQAFFNGLTGLSPTSKSKVKCVLGAILKLAESDEVIDKNPVAFIRLPKRVRSAKRALSAEELRCLIDASHSLVKPFVLLAGCAGLRRGEACGVIRSAIDKNNVLAVRQQVLQLKNQSGVSEKLKTSSSYRQIPLPKPFLEALLGCGQVSDIWICSNSEGGYLLPKNVRRELLRACKAAGIEYIGPHELRHTFISIMENEVEAPRPVVMALAGHAANGITDKYSHTKLEQLSKWMEKFWDHVSTSSTTQSCRTETENAG